MCESTFTINSITHAYYFGGIFGSLFTARIPDLYGKKVPFVALLAAQLPCYIGLVCSRSLLLSVVLSLLMGIVNAGIYNGGYINVCEYVHSPFKIHVCTLLLVMDNFTVVLVCLYFKYVSRYWLWFQILGILMNAVALVGILMIPESPEYLYSFYRFDECRAVLQRIAQWNNRAFPEHLEFDVEADLKNIIFVERVAVADSPKSYRVSIEKKEKHQQSIKIQRSIKAGLKEFVASPEPLVRNLLISLPIWAIVLMIYQINAYYDNYFPGDSYENLMYITLVEFVGYIVADLLFERVGRRAAAKLYCLGFSISLICSLGILFNNDEVHPYLDLTFTYCCKFGIAIAFQAAFWATNVLFPIIFASTTFGLCDMMGTISCFFSVDVYTLPNDNTQ